MKKPKNKQGRKASKLARVNNLAAASRGSTYGTYEELISGIYLDLTKAWLVSHEMLGQQKSPTMDMR